jgi:general secretion pathway protein D
MLNRPVRMVRWVLLLGLLAAPRPAGAQGVDLTQTTVREIIIQEGSLQEAVDAILAGSNVAVYIPSFAAGQDTIKIHRFVLRNVSIAQALTTVLQPMGLTWVMDGNMLRIIPDVVERVIHYSWLAVRFATPMAAGGGRGGGGMAGGMAGGAAGGAAGAGGAGGTGGAAGLGIMTPQQFETQLRKLLSGPDVPLIIDRETRTIYVEDLSYNVDRLESYVRSIDIPPGQVKIEVRLIEVVRTDDQNLGVSYEAGLTGATNLESVVAQLPGLSSSGFLVDLQGLALGGLYGGNLDLNAALQALQTVSEAQLLSRPSTVVMDGKLASINLTDQIPYTQAILGQGFTQTTTAFVDVGIMLMVTPTVLDSNTVHVQVNTEFSTAGTVSVTGVPTVSTRNATGSVVVKSGEIFVMAGLIRTDDVTTQTGIPVLSRIPLLGALFRHSQVRKERRELLIFVEPTILARPVLPPPTEPLE